MPSLDEMGIYSHRPSRLQAAGDPHEPYWVSFIQLQHLMIAEFMLSPLSMGRALGLALQVFGEPVRMSPSPEGNTIRERAEVWFDKL